MNNPLVIIYLVLLAFVGFCAVDAWGVLHGFGVIAAICLLSPKMP